MHRSSELIRPKSKVAVELHKDDGSVLDGFVYVGGQERILDLLNNHERFVPFELNDGTMIMVNKNAIVLVMPDDGDRMQQAYKSVPQDQMSGPVKVR